MRKLITILFVCSSMLAEATIYYISNTGSNSNNGTSTSTPWQTISKLNSVTLVPGDQVLFKRGGTWIETWAINQSGTSGNPITFGAYDAGAKPIITIQDSLLNGKNPYLWFQRGATNIWAKAYNGLDMVNRMWFDGVEYGKSLTADGVNSTYRWFYKNTTVDSMLVYATSNPASFYSSMYLPFSQVGGGGAAQTLSLTDKDWITFDNIDIQGCGFKVISLNGADHISFLNCNMGMYAQNAGLLTEAGGVDKTSDSCIVYNCTFNTGASIVYPERTRAESGASDCLWLFEGANYWEISYNTFTGWYHGCTTLLSASLTKSVSYNKIHHNYMDGSVINYARSFGFLGKFIGSVSHNTFYSNTSVNMKVNNEIGGDSNTIYYNLMNGFTDPLAIGSSGGLELATYGSGTYICTGNRVLNNTIYDVISYGIGVFDYGQATDTLVYNNEVINNIIVGTPTSSYGFYEGNNNAFVRENIFKNNIFYKALTSAYINYRYTLMNVATFNTQTTNGDIISGNLGNDPMFVNPGSDFSLQPGSPAIGAGINVGLPFFGAAPDLGAFPFQTSNNFFNHRGKLKFITQ